MQENFSQFMDKLKFYVGKKINNDIAQIQDIEGISNSSINGWRSLGTNQSLRYGGRNSVDKYTVGNNDSSNPVVSE